MFNIRYGNVYNVYSMNTMNMNMTYDMNMTYEYEYDIFNENDNDNVVWHKTKIGTFSTTCNI